MSTPNIRFDTDTAVTREWLSLNEKDAQSLLAKFHALNIHPKCECTRKSQEMYIAKRVHYYLARMPGTGKFHAPSCPSFEIDTEDRGLNGYEKSVLKLNSDGMLSLKIESPLSHKRVDRDEKPATGHISVPPVGNSAVKPESLTLSSVLAVLWEEAELNRWYPLFAGKRSWNVVRQRLLSTAENIVAKRTQLNDVLFIPESFRTDKSEEIDVRRKQRFDKIMIKKGGKTQYMVVIGRIRKCEIQGEELLSIRLAQQGNNVVYWGSKHIVKKLNLSDCLQVLEKDDSDDYMMTMMVINRDDKGALLIRDIGFLHVDLNYLPRMSEKDQELTAQLIEDKRKFIKSLPYDGGGPNVYPDYMLIDTGKQPTPLAIFHAFASEAELDARHAAKKRWGEEYQRYWIWDIEQQGNAIPTLPAPSSE